MISINQHHQQKWVSRPRKGLDMRNKVGTLAQGFAIGLVVASGAMWLVRSQPPQVCLDALNSADSGFSLAAGAMRSAGQLDVPGMNYYAGQIDQLGPKYNEQKKEC